MFLNKASSRQVVLKIGGNLKAGALRVSIQALTWLTVRPRGGQACRFVSTGGTIMRLKIARAGVGIVALALLMGAGGCSRTKAFEEERVGTASTAADFLFTDNFEAKQLQGWTVTTGTWRSGRGILTLWGRGSGHDTKDEVKIITLASLPPRNCRIEVDLRFLSQPRGEAFAGILFRYRDPFNFYWFRLCDFEKYQDRLELYEFYRGQRDLSLGNQHITFNPLQWHRLAVEVENTTLRTYLDGEEVIHVMNPDLETGTVGLALKKTAEVEFRRFRVLAL